MTAMSLHRKKPPRFPSRRTAIERELIGRWAGQFHDAAVRPGYCLVCHERVPLKAHHFIEKGYLRTELRALLEPLQLDAICFDQRNAGGICDQDHNNHHFSGMARIYRHHVPESAWEMAKELDDLTNTEKFTLHLENRYRDQGERRAA